MWKNYFCAKFRDSRMFEELTEVVWISKILLSKDRENNKRDCFVD